MMSPIPFLLGIMLFFGFPAWGSTEEAPKAIPEYTMKAAYLYNFAKLTDWPAESGAEGGSAFNLCIFGQNEFGPALDALRGKMVNNRQLRLRHITDIADAQHCQLLFVGDYEGARGARLFESLRAVAVLTVTDDDKISRAGAMLLIRTEEQRLSFDVNLDAAARAQLKFSSKLLRLANKVSGK